MSNFAFYGFLNHDSKYPLANMIWGKDSVTQTNNGKVAFHTSKDVASLYESYSFPQSLLRFREPNSSAISCLSI